MSWCAPPDEDAAYRGRPASIFEQATANSALFRQTR